MTEQQGAGPRSSQNEGLYWVLAGLLATAVFLADLALPLGVAGGALYVGVVVLFGRGSRRRWVVAVAIATTLLAVLGWLWSSQLSPPWIVATNRLISIGVIWTVALTLARLHAVSVERDEALRERESLLVRVLNGFLPICVHCKRIRDEGRWTQLESYLGTHSEAEFSHGLCESCIAEHYPTT